MISGESVFAQQCPPSVVCLRPYLHPQSQVGLCGVNVASSRDHQGALLGLLATAFSKAKHTSQLSNIIDYLVRFCDATCMCTLDIVSGRDAVIIRHMVVYLSLIPFYSCSLHVSNRSSTRTTAIIDFRVSPLFHSSFPWQTKPRPALWPNELISALSTACVPKQQALDSRRESSCL